MNHYPNLFKPIQIGSMTVPNRVCHVPTDISSSNADGSVSERDIYHHSELAKGGVGLIIVGATTPDSKTGRPTVTCLVADADNYIPGLARLADSMHKYGSKCVVQLQHPGRQCAIPRHNTMSTNDMVLKLPWSAGHEIVYENAQEKGKPVRAMTTEEVIDMVDKFSEAAWRVQQAGFDGVELHAAHGYLISQFMSPLLNRRNDRFGGSFENRMRFPLAIVSSIQQKCGRDFPILVRYSVDEWVEGGRELMESVEVAKAFELAGVAALDLSQCIQESPGAGFDPMYYPEGWTMYASEEIKKHVSIPVINSHTFRNPDFCEKVLADNKTDMVGLSRQMLADPYWAIKAYNGKTDEIRRCISCLTGCWQESMMAKKEIACAINPACGNIAFSQLKKTDTPLRLAIVGGGPAGMEAARIAATRGHTVTLFEKTGELGGAILGCCLAPGKEKMKWYADWIRRQIAKLDIEVKMNCTPSVDQLKEFDLTITATGASSYTPDCIGQENIIPFEQVIACPKVNCEYHPKDRSPKKLGEKVLLWGDGYPVIDTAAYLASIGKQVSIVTENRELGEKVEVIHMYVLRKRFAQTDAEALDSKPFKYPVEVITNSTVYSVGDGVAVVMDKNFNKRELQIDDVVTCHTRSNDAFFKELRAQGISAVNVGDSIKPRNLHSAVNEGANAALKLEECLVFNPNGSVVNDLPLDVAQMLR